MGSEMCIRDSLITASSSEVSDFDENEILLENCEVDIYFQDLVHHQKINTLYKSKINDRIQQQVEQKHQEGYSVIAPVSN